MEPRVTKREKRLHLSYELPTRIHCSYAYPIPTPNGSTLVLFGHEKGLRVLWRGGRRRKEAQAKRQSAPNPNNGVAKSQDIVDISDEDEEQVVQEQVDRAASLEDLYETEESEQDSDSPFPEIIQDVDFDLQTGVFSMTAPTVSAASGRTPRFFKEHVAVVVRYADGRIAVLSVPLQPPSSSELQDYVEGVKRSQIILRESSGLEVCLTSKAVFRDGGESFGALSNGADHLLVASVSAKLDVWKLSIKADGLAANTDALIHSITLPILGRFVYFHPSPLSCQILLSDVSGTVRIFDPVATPMANSRAPSRDPAAPTRLRNGKVGKWVISFQVPYLVSKDGLEFARRKRILDMKWALAGRGIFVLLEDGEWGVWDTLAQFNNSKNIEDFSLRGFLDSASIAEAADPGKQRKAASKLAPMTPGTRKSKADDLFGGSQKTPRLAAAGGISSSTVIVRSSQADECIVIWYGSDIYAIPSMQNFWQRSTGMGSEAGGRGLGTLYTPGLSHITDINLMNENITSISQLVPKSTAALGNMNTVRDLLISTEHRLIITQSTRPPTPARNLFEPPGERPMSRDQRMLDAGELDLGGMDRMLDSMAADGKTKKVGFAAA